MKKLDDFKKIADVNLDKMDMSKESKLKLITKISFKKLSFIGIPAIAALIAFIMLSTFIFPNLKTKKVYASNLMQGISAKKIETSQLDKQFIFSTADFSLELFKSAYTKGKNSLVSPPSVYLALGMTANGADGNTLKDFERLLGNSTINIEDLNSYYYSLANKLTTVNSGKVSIANSIWYRQEEGLNVKKDFLQTNADYYNASAYKADFNSKKTVNDINNWVKTNTYNLIDKIIDEINPDTIMYLINTVYFQDKWEVPYTEINVHKGIFQLTDGTKTSVDFMASEEDGYIKNDMAEGFIKPYENGKYSFAALLPNEGVSIDSFISSLTGESFINLLINKSEDKVSADLPKFESEYKIALAEPLKKMGLKDCFQGGKANFTKMASGSPGDVYVGDVLHKTFIRVDINGTEAGAVTKVEMYKGSMVLTHKITLNRPFLYAIVDNETKLPLFIGTMMNPEIK